jgi:ribonuclease HIII
LRANRALYRGDFDHGEFATLHFRTAYEVVSEMGKLDELPLKPPPPKVAWE